MYASLLGMMVNMLSLRAVGKSVLRSPSNQSLRQLSFLTNRNDIQNQYDAVIVGAGKFLLIPCSIVESKTSDGQKEGLPRKGVKKKQSRRSAGE